MIGCYYCWGCEAVAILPVTPQPVHRHTLNGLDVVMLLSYLLAFCRITIGILFAYSFLAKGQDVSRFARTVAGFSLLPSRLSRPAVVGFLGGELAVVVLAVAGRAP